MCELSQVVERPPYPFDSQLCTRLLLSHLVHISIRPSTQLTHQLQLICVEADRVLANADRGGRAQPWRGLEGSRWLWTQLNPTALELVGHAWHHWHA